MKSERKKITGLKRTGKEPTLRHIYQTMLILNGEATTWERSLNSTSKLKRINNSFNLEGIIGGYLAGIGAGLLAINIPFTRKYSKQVQSAIHTYNAN